MKWVCPTVGVFKSFFSQLPFHLRTIWLRFSVKQYFYWCYVRCGSVMIPLELPFDIYVKIKIGCGSENRLRTCTHVLCLTRKKYHGYLYSTKNDTLKANKENAITSVSRDWAPRLLDRNNDYSIIMSCLIFGRRVHETTSDSNREHWNRIVL